MHLPDGWEGSSPYYLSYGYSRCEFVCFSFSYSHGTGGHSVSISAGSIGVGGEGWFYGSAPTSIDKGFSASRSFTMGAGVGDLSLTRTHLDGDLWETDLGLGNGIWIGEQGSISFGW